MVEISVIIPLYNGEKYIKRCYESINNQDFDKEVEIIFVDDGSSDNSLKILNELKKNNPKITVISQQNKNVGGARNTGLKIAKGKYVSFIDIDDFISSDFLSGLYNVIEKYHAQVAATSVIRYKMDGKEKPLLNYDEETAAEDNCDKAKLIYSNGTGYGVWNKIYKRDFLIKNNLYFRENVYYEDVDFVVKAVYYAKRIATCNTGNYYYYVNKKSVMRCNMDTKKMQDRYQGSKLAALFSIKNNITEKACVNKFDWKFFGLNILRIKEDIGREISVEKYYLFDLIKIFQRKYKTVF